MDLGLVTFADLPAGVSPEQRMRNLLEEARLADELGLELFAVGEHHRPDYLVSSPATALAAIAAQTSRIRLSSAVTVLSSDDPVRVFQQFAHVDLISGGRAEIMAGRGSFIESFPLFGYELDDYDELFDEKLELLLAIRDSERVTWHGKHRAPLEDVAVWPRPVQDPLPIWIGGTQPRVMRIAAKYAHWFNLSNPGTPATERLGILRDDVNEACRAVGRDPATLHRSMFVQLLAAPTRAEVDETVAALAARAKVTAEKWRASRPGYILGTTDEVGEKLRALARGGVEHANAMLPYQHEIASIRALAQVARAL